MAVFVDKAKLEPKDLAIVRFVRISEDTTKPVIKEAHKKLDVDDGDKIEIDSDSDDEKEDVFNDLKKTIFGKTTEWLHRDFGAGEIKKIELTDGVEQGTMTIHLDD